MKFLTQVHGLYDNYSPPKKKKEGHMELQELEKQALSLVNDVVFVFKRKRADTLVIQVEDILDFNRFLNDLRKSVGKYGVQIIDESHFQSDLIKGSENI